MLPNWYPALKAWAGALGSRDGNRFPGTRFDIQNSFSIVKMSETELLRVFRRERSDEAFAELVRRYAGLVYSAAKRRLGDAALAEDAT